MSRFDRIMGLAVVVILAGIGLTLILGDRVGVTIDRVGPLGEARGTSSITVQFSEAMNRDSVEAHFETTPQLEGDFSWSDRTLIFHPAAPLSPGDSVGVTVRSGAESATGRPLLSDTSFSFNVRQPEVAYLYPATGTPQNIWLANPADPASAHQLTFSPSGIFDYSVSPDGSKIAFSERNSNTGTTDIKLLDLDSGGLTQLTNCVDAACSRPVWRPDGKTIAYERVDFNTDLSNQLGPSPARVWLLDLTAVPTTTRPLMSDLQMVGYGPQWSDDGKTIAYYSTNLSAIVVYNVETGELISVPTGSGNSGALSPDGTRLAYTDIVANDVTGVNSVLKLATLAAGEDTMLTDPAAQVDDGRALWRPDGQTLAIARRDQAVVRGYQVVEMDPATGEVTYLTDDPRYSNMFFYWDPTGQQLVLQRFPELDEQMQPNMNGRPEVWTLDVATDTLTRIAEDGMLPRWVP